MIPREKARACLEAAAADLKELSYEELERLAGSQRMLNKWRSRELEVDGEKVDVHTMMCKLGHIRKRISVELTLSADGGILPPDTPCVYFERFESGRFYPSSREKAREAVLLKALPYALIALVVIALLVLVWHLSLRGG